MPSLSFMYIPSLRNQLHPWWFTWTFLLKPTACVCNGFTCHDRSCCHDPQRHSDYGFCCDSCSWKQPKTGFLHLWQDSIKSKVQSPRLKNLIYVLQNSAIFLRVRTRCQLVTKVPIRVSIPLNLNWSSPPICTNYIQHNSLWPSLHMCL